MMVMIQTKMAMWWTWARIAVRELGSASRARSDGVPAWKFEAAEAASLSAEFERSVTTIAACAFSMEALCKELEEAGHTLDTSKIKPKARVSAGYYVGHRLVAAFGLTGAFATNLPGALDRIFTLRNDAVHFESVWKAGTHPHPRGWSAAYELTVYTLEEAWKSVDLVHEVLIEIAKSITQKKHDKSAEHIAQEVLGVHSMFDAVIRTEGLKLSTACGDG